MVYRCGKFVMLIIRLDVEIIQRWLFFPLPTHCDLAVVKVIGTSMSIYAYAMHKSIGHAMFECYSLNIVRYITIIFK